MASFVARASRLRALRAAIQDVWAESGFAFSFAGKSGRRDACPTRLPVSFHAEVVGRQAGRLPHKVFWRR